MTPANGTPRLSVVAAIIDDGAEAGGPLAGTARLGSEVLSVPGSDPSDATPQERALAQALQEERGLGQAADHAIAELLLLADYDRAAAELATGLSQALLRPGNSSQPATTSGRPRSAFVDLYRKLSLHQLNSQVRNKAAAALYRLITP